MCDIKRLSQNYVFIKMASHKHDGVLNNRHVDYLFKNLSRPYNITSRLHVIGLLWRETPVVSLHKGSVMGRVCSCHGVSTIIIGWMFFYSLFRLYLKRPGFRFTKRNHRPTTETRLITAQFRAKYLDYQIDIVLITESYKAYNNQSVA